ncbi:MAG: pyridoxal phosphate-dependent aminotransferase family protein [Alphaproteobacteria bacterium]|nr:pyridoxal phosphate-dependent aminotransferase family protein [Alphaproteobacteria bacterium]
MNALVPGYAPPPSFISRLARKARTKGIYHHNKVVDEYLPGGFVRCGDQRLLMMAGYSYLGLILDRAIREVAADAFDRFGLGAHGTRINCGTTAVHVELERRLASLTRSEDCILYPSGYQANVSTIQALFTPRDTIFSDQLNHASILDGIQASGARVVTYGHNDMADLEAKLADRGDGNALIVSDAVFSMDGDIADVPKLIELKSRFGALLMIDEAHSLGVLGANGYGVTQHFDTAPGAIDLVMGVLSKAIPGTGGYVCASAGLTDYLRHNGKSYIYSGAIVPFQAAVALACLDLIEREPGILLALNAKTDHFHTALRRHGLDIGLTATPITPVIVGDSDRTFEAADRCMRHGVYLTAIPFPVVPMGKARLRATVTADHDLDALTHAANVIAAAVKACT